MALMYDMETVNKAMQAATSLVAKDITPRERWIINQFAAMKPVEAVRVVHARWDRQGGTNRCTNCGRGRRNVYLHEWCPCCGAIMDGGAADAPR